MGEVADRLHSHGGLPENALAVTVDDGYRDFLDVAYPVFAAYEIPVTVYVATDFIDGKCWLWFDQVAYAFRHAELLDVKLELHPGRRLFLRLESGSARVKAANVVNEILIQLSNRERLAFLESLPGQLDVELPAQAPTEYRALSWNEIRDLASRSVEFGAHTQTHPILSRLDSQAELSQEILGSKRRLEEELGRAVAHFCYPNGKERDIGPMVVQTVRAAGIATGVTAESGLNHPGCNLWSLRRIGVGPDMDPMYFRQCVAGLRV
jgi:peptidoglycan/xylan/chitin deacetylase (PgdA/CDA1 family)